MHLQGTFFMCSINLKLHLSHCLFKVVDDVVLHPQYQPTDG